MGLGQQIRYRNALIEHEQARDAVCDAARGLTDILEARSEGSIRDAHARLRSAVTDLFLAEDTVRIEARLCIETMTVVDQLRKTIELKVLEAAAKELAEERAGAEVAP